MKKKVSVAKLKITKAGIVRLAAGNINQVKGGQRPESNAYGCPIPQGETALWCHW